MTIEALIIILVLIITQTVFFVITYKERQILLDRIMAKSLVEYKDNVMPEENEFPKDDPNIINLDEAKEELNG